ncbi:hypothetical protein [Saccharothrix xinjiangensis]|uniref:Peptidase inhibitor family I36 n=1 Tax=Saccharothrix xinjiangensis TaxID=204798 RepID=A0ABV9XUX0_9PSEU
MKRKLVALVATVVSCVLASGLVVPASAGASGRSGENVSSPCEGKWIITTGTSSGAGGGTVNWVGLSNGDEVVFQTGEWSGDEIQNGNEGESSWHEGPCDALADPAYNRFRISYYNSVDKWQPYRIIFRANDHTQFGACREWTGSTWISEGITDLYSRRC